MFPVSRWTLARGHRRVNYRPQICEGYVFTGVCLSPGRHPPGRHYHPPWADITTPHGQTSPPQAETPLDRHPTCPVHAGIHTPCPVHAGIHTPLSSACWDKHPPCPVHAGIRSTSGRYAFHLNAFLLIMWSQVRVSDH